MRVPRLVFAMVVVVSGCATSPPADEQPIADGMAAASSVQLCRTTYDELQQRLGTPSRDGRAANMRLVTWVVAWEPLVRYLGVAVDAQGVVVDEYWNAPTEVPWIPIDRCGSPKS